MVDWQIPTSFTGMSHELHILHVPTLLTVINCLDALLMNLIKEDTTTNPGLSEVETIALQPFVELVIDD